jgi:predicted GNAT family acetyltransferase
MSTRDIAEWFSHAYCERTNAIITETELQGIYELNAITSPRLANGSFRPGTLADRETLISFSENFHQESGESINFEAAKRMTERWLNLGNMYIWQSPDGDLACMAAVTRETQTGACISYVYTHPNHRGSGYASNLVAAIARVLLARGKTRLFLYTQMSNPTSNKIYQQVGFRLIADAAKISLSYL